MSPLPNKISFYVMMVDLPNFALRRENVFGSEKPMMKLLLLHGRNEI
jgi:hypothetical protein